MTASKQIYAHFEHYFYSLTTPTREEWKSKPPGMKAAENKPRLTRRFFRFRCCYLLPWVDIDMAEVFNPERFLVQQTVLNVKHHVKRPHGICGGTC